MDIQSKQPATPPEPVTTGQYTAALAALQFHESKIEQYKAITRRYIYAQESERVEQRKADSRKYHLENPQI